MRVKHLLTTILGLAYSPSGSADWISPYCTKLLPCECKDAPPNCAALAAVATTPPTATAPTTLTGDARKELLAVAAQRLKNYQADLATVQQNLWIQFSLTAFAIIILRREKEDRPIKIPVLGIELPLDWCHLLIPLTLAYLFMTLGFQFDHLIQERYLLWEQFAQLEAPRNGNSIHSMRMLLEDRWIMDCWFAEFHADHNALSMDAPGAKAFNRIVLLLFSLFVAAQHAVSLFLLSRPKFPGASRAALSCLILVVVVLGFCQFGFRVFGGNPNWVQPLVGVFTLAILAWLTASSPAPWGMLRVVSAAQLTPSPQPTLDSSLAPERDPTG
jgi:hypothetical protein